MKGVFFFSMIRFINFLSAKVLPYHLNAAFFFPPFPAFRAAERSSGALFHQNRKIREGIMPNTQPDGAPKKTRTKRAEEAESPEPAAPPKKRRAKRAAEDTAAAPKKRTGRKRADAAFGPAKQADTPPDEPVGSLLDLLKD